MGKTKEWEAARRVLKQRFETAGITSCEFRYVGCWRDNGLSFAHIDKRRYLTTEELGSPKAVALACPVCHQILEILPRKKMRRLILAVIRKRICQP